MNIRLLKSALLVCGLAVFVVPATTSAATATGSLLVSATVLTSCTVTGGTVAFGNYDPTAGSATNGSGTFAVLCTAGANYTVALNKGTNGSSVTARKMILTLGSDLLPYSLYRDTGRTQNWGETPNTDTVSGSGTALPQTFTVYGSIPAGASVSAGAYTDTVTITVNY